MFDLQHSLLQAIPQWEAKKMPQAGTLNVNGKYYVLASGARDSVLRLLRDPRVKVFIESDVDPPQTQAILDAMQISDFVKVIPHRNPGDPADPATLIASACANPSDCVLVTDDKTPPLADASGQSGHILRSGPTLYQFDSYKDSQAEQAREAKQDPKLYAKTAALYPADEQAWQLHDDRMEGVFSALDSVVQSSAGKPGAFASSLGGDVEGASATLETAGAQELARVPQWRIVDGKASGCIESNPKDPADKGTTLDPSVCKNELPSQYAWSGSPKNQCSIVTADGNGVIGPADAAVCLDKLKTYYFWADDKLDRCGVFTDDGVYVQDVDKGKCSYNIICDASSGLSSFVLDPKTHKMILTTLKSMADVAAAECDQPFAPVTGNDSPNLAYFKTLTPNSPLSAFMKLWYPDHEPDNDVAPYYYKCEPQAWQSLTGPGSDLPQSCAPDVLYSWGGDPKLKGFKWRMDDGGTWSGSPDPDAQVASGTVFASMSAVSTFMYGPIAIRFKIKPGVRFPFTSFGGAPGVVTYRTGSQYQDFAIDDTSVIESWSYDTPQMYDEIVRDAMRIASGKRAIKYETGEPGGYGYDRLFSDGNIDGYENDSGVLTSRLYGMVQAILKGEGRVYYAKGACRNLDKNFETHKPTYMTPEANN